MNRQRAAMLARLSDLAYSPIEQVRKLHPSADIELVDVDNSQALLFSWDDMAAVACRGTQVTENWSWADIESNILGDEYRTFLGIKYRVPLEMVPWYGAGIMAHPGYAEATRDLVPRVGDFIRKNQIKHKKTYGTGHSLGGSLMTGLASVLDFEESHTFGAPRFGNKNLANLFEGKRHYRIVYEQDVAPSFPSPAWGYRHVGERWQLSKDGSLVQGQEWRDLIHFPIAKGFLDHRVGNYVTHLKHPSVHREGTL